VNQTDCATHKRNGTSYVGCPPETETHLADHNRQSRDVDVLVRWLLADRARTHCGIRPCRHL